MTIGGINGLGSVNYYNYSRINQVKPVDNIDDGNVKKLENTNEPKGTNTPVERDTSKLLPNDEVIDFAVKKDLNSDKSLIGTDMKLENLDVKKAISDMKKDSILKEYQYFVQDPLNDNADGIVIKKG